MFKKIAASVALAGALAFSVAAPAVVSAAPVADVVSNVLAIGNWPDPMRVSSAIGNWPDPMRSSSAIGNWPDPMSSTNSGIGNWPDPM